MLGTEIEEWYRMEGNAKNLMQIDFRERGESLTVNKWWLSSDDGEEGTGKKIRMV